MEGRYVVITILLHGWLRSDSGAADGTTAAAASLRAGQAGTALPRHARMISMSLQRLSGRCDVSRASLGIPFGAGGAVRHGSH